MLLILEGCCTIPNTCNSLRSALVSGLFFSKGGPGGRTSAAPVAPSLWSGGFLPPFRVDLDGGSMDEVEGGLEGHSNTFS